jgi:hypothetical protein
LIELADERAHVPVVTADASKRASDLERVNQSAHSL